MKKLLMMVLTTAGALTLQAAPGGKLDPVAEGFPVWQGVTQKNYIMGREICPSDLRHRVTVVVEVEANDSLHAQLMQAGQVAALDPMTGFHPSINWETYVMPRDLIVLISVVGGGKTVREDFAAAMKMPKDAKEDAVRTMSNVRSVTIPVYEDVTFEGAPKAEGKYPFVYVMGPSGTKPLFQGELNKKSLGSARSAVAKARKDLASVKWEPFFGSQTPENSSPALLKALEKGKTAKTSPLMPVMKAILKDIVSKDAEKAATAQVSFDALEQTRSDLLVRIKLEFRACPHRAAYDMTQLLKYWPSEKKRLDVVTSALKAVPEAGKLAQIFCRMMVWADPAFVCKNEGEAKKIVAELNKMKKDLEKFKESKVVIIQNGALTIDGQIDELIGMIPTRVATK